MKSTNHEESAQRFNAKVKTLKSINREQDLLDFELTKMSHTPVTVALFVGSVIDRRALLNQRFSYLCTQEDKVHRGIKPRWNFKPNV